MLSRSLNSAVQPAHRTRKLVMAPVNLDYNAQARSILAIVYEYSVKEFKMHNDSFGLMLG
jgi:hypothetical protein